jgi:hypothetical protein
VLEQTVEEYLFNECSEGVLSDLALESEYWGKALSFIEENKSERLGDLSFAQRNWLIKIKESLLEQT